MKQIENIKTTVEEYMTYADKANEEMSRRFQEYEVTFSQSMAKEKKQEAQNSTFAKIQELSISALAAVDKEVAAIREEIQKRIIAAPSDEARSFIDLMQSWHSISVEEMTMFLDSYKENYITAQALICIAKEYNLEMELPEEFIDATAAIRQTEFLGKQAAKRINSYVNFSTHQTGGALENSLEWQSSINFEQLNTFFDTFMETYKVGA